MLSNSRRVLAIVVAASLSASCGASAPTPLATSAPLPATPAPSATPGATTSPDASAAGLSIVLGRPTTNSIAVSLVAQTAGQAVITYGVTGAASASGQSEPVTLAAGQPTTVNLTNLAADTAYRYTAAIDGATVAEHHFQTARAPGADFTFTIDADPHFGEPQFSGETLTHTLTNALADAPDFHVDLGDTFMTEKAKVKSQAQAAATFSGMRNYFATIAAEAPLFLVNGNHEAELGWLAAKAATRDLPLWSVALRQAWYPGPVAGGLYTGAASVDPILGTPRDGYYAFTWGDALLVVLDPFWYTTAKPQANDPDAAWGWTLGREQYDWLAATLESSDAPYTFVFTHHLVGGAAGTNEARGGVEAAGMYEWGGQNADGSDGFALHRPGWGKPIHQLLVEHGVSAVFHGHDHVYVHQELDGIVYQELPQPSIAGNANTRMAADYGYLSGVVAGSSGHLRVSVTSAGVTVAYVRASGQVDLGYEITPRS